jgi:hypothetical protein
MRLSHSGRGLLFTLSPNRREIEVASVGSGSEPVPLTTIEAAVELDENGFDDACSTWSLGTSDDELRALRSAAGAFPLVRTEYEDVTDRWRIYVTVAAIGSAPGVVRVAEEAAKQLERDLVEVDRKKGRRTADGIEYLFVFDTTDRRNAAQGVTVTELHLGEFRCMSMSHNGAEVPAAVRVEAPVPGRRERVSVVVCSPCWTDAVVSGLGLAQFDTGNGI